MFFAWISDKKKHRAGFIGIQALITLVGVCLTAFSSSNGVRYFGMCRVVFYRGSVFIPFRQGTFCINAGSSGCIPGVMGASNKLEVYTSLTYFRFLAYVSAWKLPEEW